MGYNPMDHPPAPSHWNDAQRYVSQWLSKSTLEYIPASYETKYAAQANLMHARDLYNSSLHAEMSQEDRLHMLHALQACEAVMQELERGYFRIPKHTSELLVRDSVSGHIIPVYMNLEMGVLGIRRFSMEKMCMEDVVGYSFEDLGISVVEMYRYEMGGYYRIL